MTSFFFLATNGSNAQTQRKRTFSESSEGERRRRPGGLVRFFSAELQFCYEILLQILTDPLLFFTELALEKLTINWRKTGLISCIISGILYKLIK